MKFRQKIFLITFIFVTISINLIGIIIINNNYKNLISNRIENNKSNINNIQSILRFYNINEINSELFNKENTYYEISKEEDIIYTNLSTNKINIEEIINPENNIITAVISDKKLYMATKDDDYKIILIEDIEDIFENREEQIYFFIKISMAFSFIIAFCLYIVIYFLTRRINKLDKAVKQIQDGDYSTRVKNLGSDEIGKLGESFNKMIASVDENITEIERISENRKNFIHDITHEIRTPLTSIIGYSSLIKSGKIQDTETIIEYNNKIYEEGNYLNLISEKLIDIVLLDNKKIKLGDINISRNINKIIDNTENNFEEIKFIKNIKGNIIIKSDEILLQSLITNILKNSIVACKNNIEKIIKISLIKNGEAELIIEDNGKGMSDEEIKKVVEPFYTLNQDRNRKKSGMGLGLPLCIKICEVLNAEFEIDSKIGEGTTVSIKFLK